MGLIIWLIVGGIIGWLASLIMKTDGQQGILLNVIVGIVGAFIGGWLFSQLGVGTPFGGLPGTIFVAFIGAVVLLLVLRLIRGGRRTV